MAETEQTVCVATIDTDKCQTRAEFVEVCEERAITGEEWQAVLCRYFRFPNLDGS